MHFDISRDISGRSFNMVFEDITTTDFSGYISNRDLTMRMFFRKPRSRRSSVTFNNVNFEANFDVLNLQNVAHLIVANSHFRNINNLEIIEREQNTQCHDRQGCSGSISAQFSILARDGHVNFWIILKSKDYQINMERRRADQSETFLSLAEILLTNEGSSFLIVNSNQPYFCSFLGFLGPFVKNLIFQKYTPV